MCPTTSACPVIVNLVPSNVKLALSSTAPPAPAVTTLPDVKSVMRAEANVVWALAFKASLNVVIPAKVAVSKVAIPTCPDGPIKVEIPVTCKSLNVLGALTTVSYTHLRAHET